jgi:hypothetical protein
MERSQGSRHAFGIEQPDAVCAEGAGELSLGQWRRHLIKHGKRCCPHLRGCSLQGV